MERLRYEEKHWSREEDVQKALEQYIALGERPFNKTKFNLYKRLSGDVSGKKLLDYGGGAGIMAVPYAMDGADVVLVDAESNALKTARFYAEREGAEGRLTTILSETFPRELQDERFDIVIAKDIVEHIEDDDGFIKDLSSCQETGGVLILSTQNSLSLNYLIEGSYQKYRCGNRGWMGWDPTHLRFYTCFTLKEKLKKAGYRPVKWAGVYVIPYNIVSWLFLGKLDIQTPSLRFFDVAAGAVFPFNRLGWNIIVKAEKVA